MQENVTQTRAVELAQQPSPQATKNSLVIYKHFLLDGAVYPLWFDAQKKTAKYQREFEAQVIRSKTMASLTQGAVGKEKTRHGTTKANTSYSTSKQPSRLPSITNHGIAWTSHGQLLTPYTAHSINTN